MRTLTIGINALYLIPGGVGGTEIYLRNLVQALADIDLENHYVIYTNRETGNQILPPDAPNFSCSVQQLSATSRPKRIIWEQSLLVSALKRDRIDVVLNPGYTAPYFAPCPMVTVFHDMQHRRHPEFSRFFDLLFFRLLYGLAAYRSNRLIAVSEATKRDMLHYYRIAPQKIRAIPHGVDPVFFELGRKRSNPNAKLILSVSTLHPHKNLDRLVRAFAEFHRTHPDYRLTIVGLEGFFAGTLRQIIRDLGLSDSVTLTGWIARQSVYDLFATASAFIYPTSFEGFGLPILESLAAGLPSACSNIEPLNEIVGDAALLFNPRDEFSILDALNKLVDDDQLRHRLSTAGPTRARRFSWTRTARATLHVLRWTVRKSAPPE